MAELTTSVACSNRFPVAREFVAVAVVELGRPVASRPFVVAARCPEIPGAVLFPAVVAASVPADLAATAEFPFRVEESGWVASGPVAVVDCYWPSTALTEECWAV